MNKLLFICLLSLLIGCQTNRPTGQKKIFFDSSWPSVAVGSKKANVTGFAIDFISQHQKNIYQFSTYDHLLYQLEQRECDAIISSIPKTNIAQEKFIFSDPLLKIGPLFITKSPHPIEIENIQNKKIALGEDQPSYLIAQTIPGATLVLYPNISTAFDDLDKGKVDMILTHALTALSYCEGVYKGRLHIASEPLNDEAIYLVGLKEALLPYTSDKISSLQKKWKLTLPKQKAND